MSDDEKVPGALIFAFIIMVLVMGVIPLLTVLAVGPR